ncbi:MAG: hypothetical protein K5931_09845 [Lachnospiraceae bacterium]|nr:hypothetical protein [Lachnospiraceae bacterium]
MSDQSSVKKMPSSFRYKDVFLKGKPKHDRTDSFSIKHPAMDLGRRAKIFSPFDALKGFSDELARSEQIAEESFADNGYEKTDEYP